MPDDPQARVDFARRNGLAVCQWHTDGQLAHIEFAPEAPEHVSAPSPEDAEKRRAERAQRRRDVLLGSVSRLRERGPIT